MVVQWVDKPAIEYPECDGQPMAENTLQFQWIVTIQGNLDSVFAADPQVFVAGDLFWYPMEGNNTIRQAPDTLVVFGRSKGHRGSYRQWVEGGIAPQVVWEVLSPGNRAGELLRKFEFYEKYGVEEYYVYDPDRNETIGWRRRGDKLVSIENMHGWVSPRLGIRFELTDLGLRLYRPDGQPFQTFAELEERRKEAESKLSQMEQRASQEAQRASQEARRADQEAQRASQEARRADQAEQRATEAEQLAERLASRLRELGADPNQ